jgi:hypothetical protein
MTWSAESQLSSALSAVVDHRRQDAVGPSTTRVLAIPKVARTPRPGYLTNTTLRQGIATAEITLLNDPAPLETSNSARVAMLSRRGRHASSDHGIAEWSRIRRPLGAYAHL